MPIAVFVFTDIEGSTRLWANSADAMQRALARHDAILIDAFTSSGGTVFKHTGDGACAVFVSAREAIAGAATAQRRLEAADWGELGQLRVRMAVHAGEAAQRGDDWFGPALNRCARLMSIAHGGQVVASSAGVDLARDALPPSVGLKDLGRHRLRDLAEPEHVWQIMGEGLPSAFPPLRSLDRFRGNLPIVPTTFHGRGVEVEQVASRVLEQRLVTLVGPGGVGKTRLALQTAAAVVDKFVDGTWFIELSRLTDASALDHAVVRTLGLTPRREVTEREIVIEAVRDWRALLVVDNCEHIAAAAASFVGDLLAAAPSIVVVATSREPLHVPGEVLWPVEPLPVDGGAAQLFIERAAAVNPRFAADNADEVAAVCRRLDGMPLALELAAARMRSMTTAELLGRLDRRFRLLGPAGGHVVDGRQRSLQAAVDWSFDLLDTNTQSFFSRLSVFPGSFDLEAAHAVCGLDADELTTFDLLDILVDKSLVAARDSGRRTRYRLLETMRQYGRDRLNDDEHHDGRRRHAEHFAEFVERAWYGVRSPDDVAWVERVDGEFDNIRAAVEFALETEDAGIALRLVTGLEPYNQPRRNAEIWAWAETALQLPAARRHPLSVGAGLVLAFGGHARDNPRETTRWVRWAQDRHVELGLSPNPRLGIQLGHGLVFDGHLAEGGAAFCEAIDIATSIGPDADVDRLEALYALAYTNAMLGAPDLPGAEETLALAMRLGSVWLLSRAKGAMGVTLATIDARRATAALDEAVELARRADPPYWTGSARVFAAAARADPYEAIRELASSLDDFRAAGTQQWVRRSLRDFLVHFGAVGRPGTVAFIDGCAAPVSTRPDEGRAAVRAARQQLGATRYEEARARGIQVSDAELSGVLRAEIADLFAEEGTV